MNFQQLIDARKFLSSYQEHNLIQILSNGLNRDKKYKVKMVIQNKFYTLFDQHKFAPRFYIYDSRVEHGLNPEELKEFKLEILTVE